MKLTKMKIITFVMTGSLLFSSCEAIKNTNKTQRGAAGGAAGGAVIGGVIGNNVGDGNNTAIGAIIGGVIGGAAGGYIGNRMDKQAREIENQVPGAEVNRVGEGINITFDENSGVYFAINKHDLNSASQESLGKLLKIFKEYDNTNILIEGHTDNTGRAEYNMQLSEKRANSVASYFTQNGISSSRYSIKWYGEEQPKYDNETVQGRSQNRRVEIAIIANEDLKEEAKKNTN
ncbi:MULTISPECIES: OmpA family protein [Psychroflexus]|uniref:Outer membrane protein OmpA n=1 Tax=Psychroflexus halocasei TaxID=908615 RepID=A0A1H3WNL5_9FLAO|nr:MULTISPECIES: OmpA family protein [Psychroflexus]PJX28445.1 hypothetical protein CAP47_01005 [Psychroflexus sp. S27]SDZ87944.1 Outer membrane protein OmpA [Psychroflexus halocasei]